MRCADYAKSLKPLRVGTKIVFPMEFTAPPLQSLPHVFLDVRGTGLTPTAGCTWIAIIARIVPATVGP